jgi:antitoxin VapB
MPLNIRSDEVNHLAETLAQRLRVSKTAAVQLALQNELDRLDKTIPLRKRLQALQERVRQWPRTGLTADKAFFDSLSETP